ncbi:MAG: LCCL domain-containing protein [Burkholderiales bacterium]
MTHLSLRLTALISGFVLLAFSALACADVTIDFSGTTGYGTGADTIMIQRIRVDTSVSNPFDPARPTITSSYYDIPFKFNPTTLHLEPALSSARTGADATSQCASLTVTVVSAYTGLPISGASVVVGTQTAATNSSGVANLSQLPQGGVNVQGTAGGYSATSQSTSLNCLGSTLNTLRLAMNPSSGTGSLSANQARIVLTWGENPRDLDAHLTGPSSAVQSTALTDPGDLTRYRGQTGSVYTFTVTGNASGGTVWGSLLTITLANGTKFRTGYTDDSNLSAAAVHAGALADGETGTVKVTILAGQTSYTASTKNGVTTNSYGAWDGSYYVEAGEPTPPSRFHVYYAGGAGWASDVAQVDVDDTTSYGTATITISPPPTQPPTQTGYIASSVTPPTALRPGVYRYTVHHYAGSGNIATSGASVRLIYRGQERLFTPPTPTTALTGVGDIWTVFELNVDNSGGVSILPVNTYGHVSSSGSVAAAGSTATGYGAVESRSLFSGLPAKSGR